MTAGIGTKKGSAIEWQRVLRILPLSGRMRKGLRMKTTPQTKVNLVDLGFMDARVKLIEVAAFLDRMERHGQEDDFRVAALKNVIDCLKEGGANRAERVLLGLSDPSEEPIEKAPGKGASGAWPGEVSA